MPDGSQYSPLDGIPADLYARIQNWAKWSKQRKWLSHCGSIEHKYLPEKGDIWLETEDKVRWPVDMLEAWETELAWKQVPYLHRMLLRIHYIGAPRVKRDAQRASDFQSYVKKEFKRFKVHVAMSKYDAEVYRAAMMLENVVRRRAMA